eukprot:462052-Ditylum_brightwellii.AAC.1
MSRKDANISTLASAMLGASAFRLGKEDKSVQAGRRRIVMMTRSCCRNCQAEVQADAEAEDRKVWRIMVDVFSAMLLMKTVQTAICSRITD